MRLARPITLAETKSQRCESCIWIKMEEVGREIARQSSSEQGKKRKLRNAMARLTVLYDGNCGLCRASVARLRKIDRGSRIEALDLHDPRVSGRFPQVNREEVLRLMQAVDPAGKVYAGVDAWARAGLVLPGWKFIAWLLLVPGIHFVADRVYAWVARNRYRWNPELCADGSCAVHTGRPESDAHGSSPLN